MSSTYRCGGPVLAVHKAVLAVEVIVLWKLREKHAGFCLGNANGAHTLARQLQWVGIRHTRLLGWRVWSSAGQGTEMRKLGLVPDWPLAHASEFTLREPVLYSLSG